MKIIYSKKSGYVAFMIPNTKMFSLKTGLTNYIVTLDEIKTKCNLKLSSLKK